MASGQTVLLNSGAGFSANANGSDMNFRGGRAVFIVDATAIGGGTMTLQMKTPQGNYAAVPNSALTAAGMSGILYLPAGTYRASLTGATSPSGVYGALSTVDF